ncbi:hypothetical protein M2139_000532 [Enterococcus sp. PF1-24]|uniref:DUF961 family protein n=1 Tax=unclassified Enterococcus TaxID=2608891 RepID=UPI0024751C8F|nr:MULTISPECIES: DUF961 family protein [unclassified Enterococcus]MDH6363695.1 hypothetical protein [Enterococcus sp. PFB1-1]MDH6400651.1 hypothetical protein [Enterococcus sp. PF1-24]
MEIKFDKNIIPCLAKETLGNLTFISVGEHRMGFADGEATGEIIEKRVEVSSDVQESVIRIDLPPTVDVDQFKFGDKVEIDDVEFKGWAMIGEDSYSNYADSDIKVNAKSIRKVGGKAAEAAAPREKQK